MTGADGAIPRTWGGSQGLPRALLPTRVLPKLAKPQGSSVVRSVKTLESWIPAQTDSVGLGEPGIALRR